ncbi:MAG: glucose-1-phosphate adenylyltransferase [Oscillospiraceae bacterium]|nr:glucose-1-phosphate adenylyltransferase [Oscillospiraceae bacterium]
MARKKECIAMLLAGGQGSRLGVLTKNIAKPAVPYGGKYRIIDFPLSNCVNSGINTVGILTQYQPLELNDYIGNGSAWDLDRINGGVHMLSPYQQIKGMEWYKGTANAIYQNINFIDRYNPEYVAVLSGDHIYKMDYNKMLDYHKKNNAACTIAMLEVPWEEASRFGLMILNDDNSISEFEEKPKNPRSNKASMGVYIFTWSKLRQYLIDDENNPDSSNDFGKDVIPAMHKAGERMFAYLFDGYWKDVGTIDSLWEANLDLLNPRVDLDLSDNSWKIYSRTPTTPPQYIASSADVQNSMVSEGSRVFGEVDYSILFHDVTVEEGAKVRYSIVMPGAVIKKGADVEYSIIAENAVIEEGARVGSSPEEFSDRSEWGIAVVGAGVTVGEGAQVPPKAMISEDVAKEEK